MEIPDFAVYCILKIAIAALVILFIKNILYKENEMNLLPLDYEHRDSDGCLGTDLLGCIGLHYKHTDNKEYEVVAIDWNAETNQWMLRYAEHFGEGNLHYVHNVRSRENFFGYDGDVKRFISA